ncbi:hypothetical protein Ari01nite_87360 [Paractinoplanes rishiriensis]|uniref:ANTAR domain-containing protein n=1 Tax=Paractinoplanes rishiriensis TaxID=1050105 RepID=A0A919MVC7_9ACTN|nr:hypothetical protein Ari01nite_87360 [Actinoplanes rishiriensis]
MAASQGPRTAVDADPDGAAGAVVHLAKSLLPVAAEVSVVMLRGDEAYTVAATGEVAWVLDGSQFRTGEGPCLQAAASAATVYAADLSAETRWPSWVRQGVDAGARSVLSLGLGIDDAVTGALNVYTTQPDAFPDDAIGLPHGLAGYAAAALKTIHRYDTQAAEVRHLQAAMMHRAVIEQAKGVIMGDRRCTADEAFAVLVKISQDSNRKLHDIAAALTRRAANTPHSLGKPVTTPVRRAGAAMTARRPTGQTPAPAAGTAPGSPPNAAVAPVKITTDVDQCGIAVIAVVGELVMDTADELLTAITAVLSAGPVTRVVVDLARVSFLDMAALSVLLRGRAAALHAGASFRAVRPQPLVRQVLHRTDTCLLLTAAPPGAEQALDLPGQGRMPPRTEVTAAVRAGASHHHLDLRA